MTARQAAAWTAFFLIVAAAGGGLFARSGRDAIGLGKSASATVERVVDGDTIVVRLNGRRETVRYIGVDTPESVKRNTPVECFALRASNFNKSLVAHRKVRLQTDAELRDRYGRLLAYVAVGGRSVNAALLRGGYARTFEFPPNTSHAIEFAALAAKAGRAKVGLWGAC